MIVIGGVNCQEIVAEFSEEYDILKGPSAKKGYICLWGDRFTVANGLLGLTNTTSIGGLINLFTPMAYPQISTMYATHIEIEPKGPPIASTPQLAYEACIVWAYYNCMPWSFGADDDQFNQFLKSVYAEQELNSSCEWVTVPGRATKFLGTTVSTGADYGFRIAIVDMTLTIHRMPYLPTPQVLASAGMINDAEYLGVAPGCLLFNGSKTKRTRLGSGASTTDTTYLFAARQYPWDTALNPKSGNFEKVVTAIGGNPLVQRTDLSQIIPSTFVL